jgi:hypothetical protein
VRSTALVVAVILCAVACDSTAADPEITEPSSATTTTPATTTTTVDPEQACREVAEELTSLLEDVLDELDGLDSATFSDRSLWPEDLLRLETVGVELDRAAADLGCDPGVLQAEAFAAVEGREAHSLLSRWLLELLLGEER